jgi:hypothetical protein
MNMLSASPNWEALVPALLPETTALTVRSIAIVISRRAQQVNQFGGADIPGVRQYFRESQSTQFGGADILVCLRAEGPNRVRLRRRAGRNACPTNSS